MKTQSYPFNTDKAKALIIGVGARAEDSELMQHTVNDAEIVGRELIKRCRLPKENMVLLTDKNASKEEISDAFKDLADSSLDSPLEIFFFYFSGHGCVIDREYYLVCSNTSNKAIKTEGIASTDLISMLQSVNTQKLVVLLDCCHAEGMTEWRSGIVRDDVLTIDKPNRIVLSACNFEQVSFLSKPVSVFTFALLEALGGRHLTSNEKDVTIFDTAMYVRERVTPLSRGRQKPQLNILQNNLTSNFVIAFYPEGKPGDPVFDEAFRLLDAEGKEVDVRSLPESDERFRNEYDWIRVNVNLGNENNLLITVEGAANTVNVNLLNIDELVGKMDEAEELKRDIASSEDEKVRLQKSQRLQKISKQINEQRDNIKALATTLSRIEIDTDRLRKAKEEFLRGNIAEADRLLNAEELASEQKQILDESGRVQAMAEDLKIRRIHNSSEFLFKARLTLLSYDDPNRYKNADVYFRQSIESYRNTSNLYEYAAFLRDQQRTGDAIRVFNECIWIYENAPGERSLFISDVASAYNNLGNLYEKINDHDTALNCYRYATALYESAEKEKPGSLSNDYAQSLNILANFYLNHRMYDDALDNYSKSLAILSGNKPHETDEVKQQIADIYNNLGNLYFDTKDVEKAYLNYESSLKLYEALTKSNPEKYKPGLGTALSNMANVFEKAGQSEKAIQLFARAIEIREELAKNNPALFKPALAMTLNRAGIFYMRLREIEIAEQLLLRSYEIRKQFAEMEPDVFEDDMAETLNNLALIEYSRDDLLSADKKLENLRLIYERLSQKNPAMYEVNLAQNCFIHGVVKYRTDRREEGVKSIKRSIEIAERYQKAAVAADLLKEARRFLDSLNLKPQG